MSINAGISHFPVIFKFKQKKSEIIYFTLTTEKKHILIFQFCETVVCFFPDEEHFLLVWMDERKEINWAEVEWKLLKIILKTL